MTPEGWVKNEVKKILNEHGAFYTMPVTGGYGRSGVPDFICCYHGMFFTIETKHLCTKFLNGEKDSKGPTALQLKTMQEIRNSKGITLVVDQNTLEDLSLVLHNKFKVDSKIIIRG